MHFLRKFNLISKEKINKLQKHQFSHKPIKKKFFVINKENSNIKS